MADMVVVNSRYVWPDSTLEMKVHQNDGCRIIVNFLYDSTTDGKYACEGEWDWNSIEAMTTYYRDKINIDKNVSYSDVINRSSYECEKLPRKSVQIC